MTIASTAVLQFVAQMSDMGIYHQLSQLIALPTSSDAFLMADWLVQEPS